MRKKDVIREYLARQAKKGGAANFSLRGSSGMSKIGKKGGKARAKKYSKEQLSEWGKRGGRPPKKER